MLNITFQQIELFLTVADLRSLTKASQKLYITQPTLTKTLQRFEAGLGFEVFIRKKQGVELTEAGDYLYKTFKELYGDINTAVNHAAEISKNQNQKLRILLPSSYDFTECFSPIRDILELFECQYPEILIEERLYDFTDIKRHFEDGSADVIISQSFTVSSISGINFMPICPYPIFLVMSSSHPLAGYDMPPAELLAQETVYLLSGNDPSSQTGLLTTCRKMGFQPKNIISVDNFQTHLHILSSGKGISFCGKFRTPENDLKFYPLNEIIHNTAQCGAAWRKKDPGSSTRLFLSFLEKNISTFHTNP